MFSTPPYPHRKAFIVNPCAYLYKAFGTDGGFFKMMRAQLQEHRNTSDTPWRLVLYADEVVPGNQLASVNSRKIWVMYFYFLGVICTCMTSSPGLRCLPSRASI